MHGSLDATEALKQSRHICHINSRTVVDHLDPSASFSRRRPNVHGIALVRVADRVAQQIGEHLRQSLAVGTYMRQMHRHGIVETDIALAGQRLETLDDLVDDIGKDQGLNADFDFARGQSLQIEQIIHQRQQVVR